MNISEKVVSHKALKGHVVYARLSDEERKTLDQMRASERRSVSDMIRQAVAEAAERRGLVKAVVA